mgnify:CR=1 FL=1
MTLAADAKKIAAQFSKVAKLQLLTTMIRDECGSKITRKELKAFEKNHKLVVQWVARREDPVQKFRTPLGFPINLYLWTPPFKKTTAISGRPKIWVDTKTHTLEKGATFLY